jgi:multiple sugar transport system permease protein
MDGKAKGIPQKALGEYRLKLYFIGPTLLVLIVMNIFPLIWSLGLSFTNYSSLVSKGISFVGFANYSRILSDPFIWKYFQTTARFVIIAVGIEFLLGFGLALLLKEQFRGWGLVTTLILIPMMLSPVVVGLFWTFIMDANFGLLNFIIGLLGFKKVLWLTNPHIALYSVAIVDIWMWTPFVMLISLTGLLAIPKSLYEAADIDMASWWFKFRRITLPLVSPLLVLAVLFRVIDAFKMFDLVFIMTGGGPGDVTETVSMSLYRLAFNKFKTGESCAMAYIILILIIALSNLLIRWINRTKAA